MNKTIFILIAFLFVLKTTLSAQNLYKVNSPTFLYENPNKESRRIGAFTTQSQIIKLNEVDSEWWEIEADNFMKGYLQSAYVKDSLKKDLEFYTLDSEKIIDKDSVLLSYVLYVHTENITGEKYPFQYKEFLKNIELNDQVKVKFLPFHVNSWVNIGGEANEERILVKRKDLGNKIGVAETIAIYKSINERNVEERRVWINKVQAFAYSDKESYEDNSKALEICLEYVKERGENEDLEKQIESQLELLGILRKSKIDKNSQDYFVEGNYLEINTMVISSDEIAFDRLLELGSEYKKTKQSYPVCSQYADTKYVYSEFGFTAYMKERERTGFIQEVDLSKQGNAFVIGDLRIDNTIDEKIFVEEVSSHFYTDWAKNPHKYIFHVGENRYITLIFKNGKPKSYNLIYKC